MLKQNRNEGKEYYQYIICGQSQQNHSLFKINRASTIKTLRNVFLRNPLSSLLLDRITWAGPKSQAWWKHQVGAQAEPLRVGPAGRAPLPPGNLNLQATQEKSTFLLPFSFAPQLNRKTFTDSVTNEVKPILHKIGIWHMMVLEDFVLWMWNISGIALLWFWLHGGSSSLT